MENLMDLSLNDKISVFIELMVSVPYILGKKLLETDGYGRIRIFIGLFISIFATGTAVVIIARGTINITVGLWQILVLLKRHGPGTWMIHAVKGIIVLAAFGLPFEVLKGVLGALSKLFPIDFLYGTDRQARRDAIQRCREFSQHAETVDSHGRKGFNISCAYTGLCRKKGLFC